MWRRELTPGVADGLCHLTDKLCSYEGEAGAEVLAKLGMRKGGGGAPGIAIGVKWEM